MGWAAKIDASWGVGSQYGPKATAPCADHQSAAGVSDGQAQLRNQEEGSTNGEGVQIGTGGSRADRDPSRGAVVKAQLRQMPAELGDGEGVCVMCSGREPERRCKWCDWPLHGKTCALPVRDSEAYLHPAEFPPYPMEEEEAACLDCLCRERPPCCVSRYAAF